MIAQNRPLSLSDESFVEGRCPGMTTTDDIHFGSHQGGDALNRSSKKTAANSWLKVNERCGVSWCRCAGPPGGPPRRGRVAAASLGPTDSKQGAAAVLKP